VKLKNLPLLLFPFRRPGRRYGYVVAGTECGGVRIARWLHPREQPKRLTAAVAEEYKKYIAAGDFCIDIGAHSGDSTLPMAVAAGRTGLVLALEPNPFVYPALEKNARMNRGLVNIHPVMAAAAAADAPLLFNYSDAGFCNGGGHAKINAARHGHFYPLEVHGIDLAAELRESFAGELARLKFIKVDTEGGDLFVLQSLAEIIERRRPHILAEVYKHTSPDYRRRLLRFLQSRGYTVYKTGGDAQLKGETLGAGDMMRWGHYDVFCTCEERSAA